MNTTKKQHEYIASATKTLMAESLAIKELAECLDASFLDAINLLLNVKHRVVLTGMGKSGHIARKISATLASTGTPSLFVHPAEASHGDLGMIAKGDVVVALSNSGRIDDLASIINYCKRFLIPIIGVTRNAKSALAKQSDVHLLLPNNPEACPMGLAPTTSSTMMLALGDAIAVVLLEARKFTAEDFKVFHPGGQLGHKLLKVSDLMHTGEKLPLVSDDELMNKALLKISEKSFGCAAVLDKKGYLVGVITDGDLRRHMQANFLNLTTREVMTKSPKTIKKDALASEALGIMNHLKITSLFIVDDENKPIGLLHIHDCLRAGVQ